MEKNSCKQASFDSEVLNLVACSDLGIQKIPEPVSVTFISCVPQFVWQQSEGIRCVWERSNAETQVLKIAAVNSEAVVRSFRNFDIETWKLLNIKGPRSEGKEGVAQVRNPSCSEGYSTLNFTYLFTVSPLS